MGHFSIQLQAALKAMGWSQVEMLRHWRERPPAVSQSQLSRYCDGSNLPEPDKLEAMGKLFPKDVRNLLVIAYLLDHIPPFAQEMVEIVPAGVRATEDAPTYGRAPHGSELKQAIQRLEMLALNNPQAAKFIIETVRLLDGLPIEE